MFDLFRSREKSVRILLGFLLFVVAISMLTYLIPNYNTGSGSSGSSAIVAEIGQDTITLPEVQRLVQMTMRNRQLPAEVIERWRRRWSAPLERGSLPGILRRRLAPEATVNQVVQEDELRSARN